MLRNSVVLRGFAAVLSLSVALAALAQEAPSEDVRHTLAPTGTLRVGVYPGSPTSEVRDPSGQVHGVAVELGAELGRRLGIPVRLVEYPRVAAVVDAIAGGEVDVTVTNASPARAERVAFTAPVLGLELGALVPNGSAAHSISDLDAPGRRVGITQGSTSERTLPRVLPQASLTPVPTMERVVELMAGGSLDAFATNKSVLYQLSDALPGSRVVDGRWGVEHLAVAYPKGRDAGAAYLAAFVAEAQTSGLMAGAISRAGLRGQAERDDR